MLRAFLSGKGSLEAVQPFRRAIERDTSGEEPTAFRCAERSVYYALDALLKACYFGPDSRTAIVHINLALKNAWRSAYLLPAEQFLNKMPGKEAGLVQIAFAMVGDDCTGQWGNGKAEEIHWQNTTLTARFQELAPPGFVEPVEELPRNPAGKREGEA